MSISWLILFAMTNTGEADTFRQQMIDLLPRLRRFAYTLTSNRFDADDLVQAACERALGRKEQFKIGTRMDSWMFRIIYTLRVDSSRSKRSRTPHSSFNEEYNTGGAADNSSIRIEAKLMLDNVMQAMEQLSESNRVVLALVCVDGLSYKEAAMTLDVPVGTVMSRLARARVKLNTLIHGNKEIKGSH